MGTDSGLNGSESTGNGHYDARKGDGEHMWALLGEMQDREEARTDPDEGINFYDKCDGNTSVDAADERRKAGRSAISQRREESSR